MDLHLVNFSYFAPTIILAENFSRREKWIGEDRIEPRESKAYFVMYVSRLNPFVGFRALYAQT